LNSLYPHFIQVTPTKHHLPGKGSFGQREPICKCTYSLLKWRSARTSSPRNL